MPQVLKEDVRNRIIESAKKEFMQKGYEKTNMRSIAHNCSMTVGNVYRYFKNKEELSKYIVSNVVDKIDIMVKELTDNEIELLNDSCYDDVNTIFNEYGDKGLNINLFVNKIIAYIFDLEM